MIKLNGHLVIPTIFPDGTSQVWHLSDEVLENSLSHYTITWKFGGEGEIMHIAQLKWLLDQKESHVHLVLDYLPYGRQDKPVSNDSTFALMAFSMMINNLCFNTVQLIDPHSEIAINLIARSHAIFPVKQMVEARDSSQSTLICYPDKGALHKYKHLYPGDFIDGEKLRDPSTGFITEYTLNGNCSGENVLIVDDICDGGATFIILAKELLERGAKKVCLFVTYGIFSKGLQVLKDAGISEIYTKEGKQEC